jgi:hypothetical protein
MIPGHDTCSTMNIIYLITCKCCKLQYVEQTRNSIHDKFYGHIAEVRSQNNMKPVSSHFNSANHSINDVDVTIIQQSERNVNKRLRLEEVWIKKIHSMSQMGMNLIQR